MQIKKGNIPLNEVWIKAAVLGASWAAIEIVLGSFLHNLRVPFKGNILTSIGFIILIVASFQWKDKGLFWRSGLICALMKTMSPSAVIFGPMIAIFMEALFLEVSTRVFGRNFLGFVVGAAFAMSWILFQRIFNLLLIYGFKIVEIYTELTRFIESQFSWQFNLALLPLLLLLILYIAFGIFTVMIAFYAGKKIAKLPQSELQSENKPLVKVKKAHAFDHSIPWLIFNFTAMIAALIAIGFASIWLWFPCTILLVLLWTNRYKRAMRQMMRPKFWLFFGLITLASSLIITYINDTHHSWTDGILTGIQINFRAAIIISGFTVLGTELYHPRILAWFGNSRFRNVHVALSLAFETLPSIMAQLPSVKQVSKQPFIYLQLMLEHADQRVQAIKNQINQKIIVLSGPRESGKTSRLHAIYMQLKQNNVKVGGFVSTRILNGNTTVGYKLLDLQSGIMTHLLSEDVEFGSEKVGRFFINQKAFEQGNQLITSLINQAVDVLIMDEIGKLEVQGLGWANCLHQALHSNVKVLIITANPLHLNAIAEKFKITPDQLISTNELSTTDLADLIKSYLQDS